MWVTLNTPPLNLQSLECMAEMEEIVSQAERDESIRALVLTGSGDRVFCAGSDVKEFPALRSNFVEGKLRRENDVFTRLAELPFPTVAALNGSAMGGGFEMALCCDFRIMSSQAKIGLPEIFLGNFPGSGGVMRLTKLVGPARAFELICLGRSVDADTAIRLGLVHEAVEPEYLQRRALAMAGRLAKLPRSAAGRIKALVHSATYETAAQSAVHGLHLDRNLLH